MTLTNRFERASLIVIGIGGHALDQGAGAGAGGDAPVSAADEAARHLAPFAREARLVLTHGSGPQIGRLALESVLAARALGGEPAALDVLDAEAEGLMGYAIEQALRNEDSTLDPVVVLTQVLVDVGDPAFGAPSKPVGPVLAEAEATRLVDERGWITRPVEGGHRRVVPSPEPVAILEIESIRALTDRATTVICAGGGGIPVIETSHGLRGVEAVIDKDAVSALLAIDLEASTLLLLTDVDAVYERWGEASARLITRRSADELGSMEFEAGSMAPKVAAACRFASATGRTAGIGRLADARAMLDGRAGTVVFAG